MNTLVIYFDEEGKCTQVITPRGYKEGMKFDGNWKHLADAVTGGNYHHYKVV